MRAISINPLARAVGIIGVIAALVSGVTFAALSTTATLTNNTINSATAGLTIWDGDSFEVTAPGFTVTDLVPGTPTAELPFYLKNSTLPLNITVQSSEPVSYSGIDNWADVKVTIIGDVCNTQVDVTLADLIAGPVALPCNPLPANSQGDSGAVDHAGNYSVKFNIPADQVTGSSASIGSFNWTFTGTQVEI